MKYTIFISACLLATACAAIVRRDAPAAGASDDVLTQTLNNLKKTADELSGKLQPEKVVDAVKKAADESSKAIIKATDNVKKQIEKSSPELQASLNNLQGQLQGMLQTLQKTATDNSPDAVKKIQDVVADLQKKGAEVSKSVEPQLASIQKVAQDATKSFLDAATKAFNELVPQTKAIGN